MAITNECRKFESHRQCDVAQNRFYTGNSGVPTLLNNCWHDVKPQIKQMNSAYVNAICAAFFGEGVWYATFNIQHRISKQSGIVCSEFTLLIQGRRRRLEILPVAYAIYNNPASRRSDLRNVACEQQKRRPVCASTQSDQRLYDSHSVKYNCKRIRFSICPFVDVLSYFLIKVITCWLANKQKRRPLCASAPLSFAFSLTHFF